MLRMLTLAALALGGLAFAADSSAPAIDKQKLETYLRYAEGYASQVKFAIDDPTASPYKGYFRVLVHLSNGPQKLERVYYMTRDGRYIVNGNVWDLSESPFLDTLEHLPTNGPSFGPADAKITIAVFSDFECPYCRELAQTIRTNIPKKYPTQVRVIFEDFPLESIHKWARAAAEASHCMAEQKPEAFWAFHDWIFEHQQEINPSNLSEKTLAIAKQQNLDVAKVASCMDTHATAAEVTRNLEAGQALQIQQTPTFFVNGRTVGGAIPWDTMNTVLQMELNRPKGIPGPSPEKCCEVTMPTVTGK